MHKLRCKWKFIKLKYNFTGRLLWDFGLFMRNYIKAIRHIAHNGYLDQNTKDFCFILKGDANQNVAPTVNKTSITRRSDSLVKSLPPKLPPKPKKQPSLLPSTKSMDTKPKPLLESKSHPYKPNRIGIQRNFTKQPMMVRKSFNLMPVLIGY